jgi:hypothetical protein
MLLLYLQLFFVVSSANRGQGAQRWVKHNLREDEQVRPVLPAAINID